MSPTVTDRFYTYDSPYLAGTDRLDVHVPALPTEDTVDWEDVNRAIQAVYRGLTDDVQQACPSATVRRRHTISHLALFSYCAFEQTTPQSSVESVVVGVDFTPDESGQRITVRADVSGEDNGIVYMNCPTRQVAARHREVREAGVALARQLRRCSNRIVAILAQVAAEQVSER